MRIPLGVRADLTCASKDLQLPGVSPILTDKHRGLLAQLRADLRAWGPWDMRKGETAALQRRACTNKLTVCTKKVLKFLASGRSSCDHGISPFRTLLTGST